VRYWSLLFALAALFAIGTFIYSPFSPNWWLPNSSAEPYHVVSTFGRDIDSLYLIILWITGIVFIGTQIALVWETYRYTDRPGRVADYFHGSQRLEVIWTIIPAAILVFIALYQMGTWASIKFRSAAPRVQPLAEVTARQFQWVMRYPGPDGKLHTPDDVHLVNDLHFVKDKTALIFLKSSDVLHSFYLPELRIKQDAVPGLNIPVWFDCDREGQYELLCAELCGWGHYKMRSHVTVHGSQEEFDDWMRQKIKAQNQSQVAVAAGPQGR
jgi:cytochrome c oxidase subunit 2